MKELRTSRTQQTAAQEPLGAPSICSIASSDHTGPLPTVAMGVFLPGQLCLSPLPLSPLRPAFFLLSPDSEHCPLSPWKKAHRVYFQEYLNFSRASQGQKVLKKCSNIGGIWQAVLEIKDRRVS